MVTRKWIFERGSKKCLSETSPQLILIKPFTLDPTISMRAVIIKLTFNKTPYSGTLACKVFKSWKAVAAGKLLTKFNIYV